MQVKREKKAVNIPLPNVTLFLIIAIAFLIIMSANHLIIQRLMLGTLEDDPERVFVTLFLLALIFAFGGWVYHINWQKKRP